MHAARHEVDSAIALHALLEQPLIGSLLASGCLDLDGKESPVVTADEVGAAGMAASDGGANTTTRNGSSRVVRPRSSSVENGVDAWQ